MDSSLGHAWQRASERGRTVSTLKWDARHTCLPHPPAVHNANQRVFPIAAPDVMSLGIFHVFSASIRYHSPLLDNFSFLQSEIQFCVLDEADLMLQMGFQEPVEQIFREMPENKQTTLWSATMPRECLESVSRMRRPSRTDYGSVCTYDQEMVGGSRFAEGQVVTLIVKACFSARRKQQLQLLRGSQLQN